MPKPISNIHTFSNFPSPPETPSFGNNKITQIENPSITGELEPSNLREEEDDDEEEPIASILDLV